jgi:hypothetical protein
VGWVVREGKVLSGGHFGKPPLGVATGADHLQQYLGNGFSTVPTLGTLFLLNFIAATIIAMGLLLPLRLLLRRFAELLEVTLAISGIGLASLSLIGLWIGESASLFGFTDHGHRPAIVAAIVAEAVAIVALSAYLISEFAQAGIGPALESPPSLVQLRSGSQRR